MNCNLHLLKAVGEYFNFTAVREALNHGIYHVIVYA